MDTQLSELIDKTAQWIVQHGSTFENKLMDKEKDNPKFSFLLEGDENNSFYKDRIEFFKNQNNTNDKSEEKWYDKLIATAILSSTPLEIETIKLTAQFIALNGKSFTVTLQSKYRDNGQFAFLDEEHHLNAYFQFLLNSYQSIYNRLSTSNPTQIKPIDVEEERELELERILEKVNNISLFIFKFSFKKKNDLSKIKFFFILPLSFIIIPLFLF